MNPTSGTPAKRTRWYSAFGALIAAALSLAPTPALAHGNIAAGDFYAGLLQPVFHFESLLPIVAVALWSTQLGKPNVWRLPLVFMAAAFAGSVAAALGLEFDATTWIPYVVMFVLGLLVASCFRLSPAGVLALGVVAGLAHGYVALFGERDTVERPILYLLGVCGSIGLLCYHLESLVLRFPAFWMQIAVRVLGSWIAAVGLLVAVLQATTAARAAG